uniref:C-type lectin domain-containing protein n=1 Tax=Acrobeloides nanus TaxID=290746 RepID=A0A914DTR1_9BILA
MNSLVLFVGLVSFAFANSACPDGTIGTSFNKLCYKVVKTPATWLSAQFDCNRAGGDLAASTNVFTNQFLLNLSIANFPNPGGFWIGGSNLVEGTGNWSWIDGNVWSYTNWASGRPRNINSYDAIQMHSPNGFWYDASKTGLLPYICEIPINPSRNCPEPNWVYFGKTGSCYQVLAQNDTWVNQHQACLNLGADLASIHSNIENLLVGAFTLDTLQTPQASNGIFFVGLNKNSKGNWTWSDGTSFDYGYMSGPYGNYGSAYGSLQYSAFYWAGVSNDLQKYPAVCKSDSF